MPSGAKRKYSVEMVQAAHQMSQAGKTYDDIAEELGAGLTARKVGSMLHGARQRGEIPKYRRKGYREYLDPDVDVGTLKDFFAKLDGHVAEWLVSNTPEGATVVDTVRMIVVDAYFEDNKDDELD